jgi:hypothetical protein
MTLGEKRNMACRLARGDIIVHWDDDDWSGPGRIADQVARLLHSGASLTGYHSMFFWNRRSRRAYHYESAPDFPLGTSLCYRREIWNRHPFEAKTVGEDNAFVARARKEMLSAAAQQQMVAVIHERQTSPKRVNAPCFVPVDPQVLPQAFFEYAR